ncbi:hypothetical protein Ae505Ps2_1244c [Pseudonocardia sp. Ae505_Ps2]|nr:hypothetical protein Ae331Ps2_1906c [Pseudonocardia sp. Ae331_Ps2]OLM11121.1 hypothetical protein Ae505Ps2_1244c [Pseudonocardia sp. Ae505_Ps2]
MVDQTQWSIRRSGRSGAAVDQAQRSIRRSG